MTGCRGSCALAALMWTALMAAGLEGCGDKDTTTTGGGNNQQSIAGGPAYPNSPESIPGGASTSTNVQGDCASDAALYSRILASIADLQTRDSASAQDSARVCIEAIQRARSALPERTDPVNASVRQAQQELDEKAREMMRHENAARSRRCLSKVSPSGPTSDHCVVPIDGGTKTATIAISSRTSPPGRALTLSINCDIAAVNRIFPAEILIEPVMFLETLRCDNLYHRPGTVGRPLTRDVASHYGLQLLSTVEARCNPAGAPVGWTDEVTLLREFTEFLSSSRKAIVYAAATTPPQVDIVCANLNLVLVSSTGVASSTEVLAGADRNHFVCPAESDGAFVAAVDEICAAAAPSGQSVTAPSLQMTEAVLRPHYRDPARPQTSSLLQP